MVNPPGSRRETEVAMPTQKTVKCRICGREFTPAWNHPEQTVCYDGPCRRKAAAERSARYAKKRKSTSSGRRKYAEKERKRYLRSKAGIKRAKPQVLQLNRQITLNSLHGEFCHLRRAFAGLLKLLNAHFGREITYEECRNAGGGDIPNQKK